MMRRNDFRSKREKKKIFYLRTVLTLRQEHEGLMSNYQICRVTKISLIKIK